MAFFIKNTLYLFDKALTIGYFCSRHLIIMWQKIPAVFRNKYVLVITAFLVWLTFFDRNNFISQVRLGRTLNEKRTQKEFYQDQIRKDSISMHELMSDTTLLEKFAREKYLMKREDEDIYLIIKDKP